MASINRNAGGAWRQKRTVINGLQTKDIDSVKLDTFSGIKYILHFKNTTEDKYKTIELLATRINGNQIEDSVVGVLGDGINIDTNLIIDSTDVILRLINNESFLLNVSISKLITS